jgi:hypothetical protein
MRNQSASSRIRSLARNAEHLVPSSRAEQAILGHFLGALYGLAKANALRVRDRSGDALPTGYAAELRRVARSIGDGRSLNDVSWLADFYLNSALYRLAAVGERLPKYAGHNRRLVKDVSEDVNQMKHRVEGLLGGRRVGLNRALAAAERVSRALHAEFSLRGV